MNDVAYWHRRLCSVTDQLVLSGDLPYDDDEALQLLGEWTEAGITHVLDTRTENDSSSFLGQHAPELQYTRFPTEDDGRTQPDWWFDEGVGFASSALADRDAVLLVHCSMGINRGPSMAFRILLERGWEPLTALNMIRNARPIADIAYAHDALDHHHRRHNISEAIREDDKGKVEAWLRGYV